VSDAIDTNREAVERLAQERAAKAAECRLIVEHLLDAGRTDAATVWRMSAEQADAVAATLWALSAERDTLLQAFEYATLIEDEHDRGVWVREYVEDQPQAVRAFEAWRAKRGEKA